MEVVGIVVTTSVASSYHKDLLKLTSAILACEVFAPGQLLACPKEAIADPLSKYLQ